MTLSHWLDAAFDEHAHAVQPGTSVSPLSGADGAVTKLQDCACTAPAQTRAGDAKSHGGAAVAHPAPSDRTLRATTRVPVIYKLTRQ